MEELSKKDVEVLDFMIDRILLNGMLTYDDFTQTTLNLEKNTLEAPVISEEEFSSYLYVLDKYKVCKTWETKDLEYAKKTSATLDFKKQGGFKKIYYQNEKQKELEELDYRSKKTDLELAEKTLKEFPRTKWFARIGFGIAVILMLKELIMIFANRN